MPALSLDLMTKVLPPEKAQQILDTVFGPKQEQKTQQEQPSAVDAAYAARDSRFQDWINARKQNLEQQRTEAAKMARFNALGNALTTMVQPLGWAAGGSTGGVQPYDNRQYLGSFNRAVKASDDIRNLGDLESEYQFKLADERFRREQTLADAERQRQQVLEDYQNKANIDLEKQKEIFNLRSNLEKQKVEGRIRVAEAGARARYIFRIGGKAVDDAVRDELLRQAGTSYLDMVTDYNNRVLAGEQNVPEPPTYEEYLKDFAERSGYNLTEGRGGGSSRTSGGSTGGGRRGGRHGGHGGDGRENGGLNGGGSTGSGGDGRESGGLKK